MPKNLNQNISKAAAYSYKKNSAQSKTEVTKILIN